MLYVTKIKSKKSGKEYLALIKESAYNKKTIITFDALAIYKLVGKKRADLDLGEIVPVVPTRDCTTCKHFISCEPSTCGLCDQYEPS